MITRNLDKSKRPTAKQVGQALNLFRPSPTITVVIKKIKLVRRGNLRDFADVELSLHGWPFLLLRGVRIVQQTGQSAWVQMPHQKSDVNGKWYPIARSLDPDMFASLKQAVLAAYQAKLGGWNHDF